MLLQLLAQGVVHRRVGDEDVNGSGHSAKLLDPPPPVDSVSTSPAVREMNVGLRELSTNVRELTASVRTLVELWQPAPAAAAR